MLATIYTLLITSVLIVQTFSLQYVCYCLQCDSWGSLVHFVYLQVPCEMLATIYTLLITSVLFVQTFSLQYVCYCLQCDQWGSLVHFVYLQSTLWDVGHYLLSSHNLSPLCSNFLITVCLLLSAMWLVRFTCPLCLPSSTLWDVGHYLHSSHNLSPLCSNVLSPTWFIQLAPRLYNSMSVSDCYTNMWCLYN